MSELVQFAEGLVPILNDALDGREAKIMGVVKALEARVKLLETRPDVTYAGIFQDGVQYKAGTLATHAGGLWLAVHAFTTARPGTDASWRLVVKRGEA